MKRAEIIEKVKSLNLPQDSYVVYGSGPMAFYGIREASDIDLYVSSEVLNQLAKRGWKKVFKGPKDDPLTSGIFEAHDNWDFSDYSPTLRDLQASAVVEDGVSFASLQEVRKWKAASTRVKFQKDVKLIDSFLGQS